MSTLEGLLLSDGCLQRAQRSLRWHYEQTCCEPTFLAWAKARIPGGAIAVAGPYGRSGYYSIRTHVDEAYGIARERWYVTGLKGIPIDFEPTPASMLAAYLGDGSLRSQRGRVIRLSTCAFALPQVEHLAESLRCLGFDMAIHRMHAPYHELVVRASSVADFLQWIGPCPLPAYARKWALSEYAVRPCGRCGCPQDEATPGCVTCYKRRWARERKLRLRTESPALP